MRQIIVFQCTLFYVSVSVAAVSINSTLTGANWKMDEETKSENFMKNSTGSTMLSPAAITQMRVSPAALAYTKIHVPARDSIGKRISCWSDKKCCEDCHTLGFKSCQVHSCKKCQCDRQ